jgi:preprotein translocase subunit SecD
MKKLRENSLSLGLDLQGGMHVTLQMDTPQLVRELAGEYKDSSWIISSVNQADRLVRITLISSM